MLSDLYNYVISIVGSPPSGCEEIAFITTCLILLVSVSFIFKLILLLFKR